MVIKKKFFAFSLACISILFLSVLGALLSFRTTVSAESGSSSRITPVSDIEVHSLTTPQNVFCYNDIIAINQNSASLLVFDGEKELDVSSLSFTDLSTIKMVNANYIYAADNGSIYRLTLSDSTVSNKEPLKNSTTTENIGSDFDYNGNYLIANNAQQIIIYTLNDTTATQINNFTSKNKSPIAINSDNSIFYLDTDSNLCKSNIDNTEIKIIRKNVAITKMIADTDYIYYIEGTEVFRISTNAVATDSPQNITITDSDFDLGKLVAPTGLCFKESNIFVTDTNLNAIQEFRVTADSVEFTGFAIAKDKTAYNRLGSIKDVDRYGDRVAVLSDKKITVMTVDDSFDGYDKSHFSNLFVGSAVSYFALGKNSLLALDNETLVATTLNNGATNTITLSVSGNIKDIVYQSGCYYVAIYDGTTRFFKILESDFSFSEYGDAVANAMTAMAVDVFGNIITLNGYNKVATDLKGNIYALSTDNTLYKKSGENMTATTLVEVSAFAMQFDKKDVYYANGNADYLFLTKTLDNVAISSLSLPDNYTVQGESVDISDDSVKIYKIKTDEKNVNVYSFTYDENKSLSFVDFATQESEYYPIAISGGMVFLAGNGGVVMIDENQLTIETRAFESVDKDVYVTTGVHAYYLPVITKTNLYVIKKDNTEVIFKKDDKIAVSKKITVADRTFYLATANSITFYVPAEFTVDELSKDYKYDEFVWGKVKKTTAVYAEESLSNQSYELAKDTSIKLISKNNGVYKIAYKVNGDWVEGYIKSSAIKDEAGTTVRNVLMVLATIACLCGSITYFLLRKKNN